MKNKHLFQASPSRHTPLKVVLIGSGGNGSAVLFGLPYLHQAMQAWGFSQGLDVTVMDGDTVSPTNCVRQPFGASDIGLEKATVLVSRVNLFHGLQWKSAAEYFTPDHSPFSSIYSNAVDLVISCVDTRAARQQMHKAFHAHTGAWQAVRYWLDLGNNASNGQFVLGQPLNSINKPHSARLRTVAELYPAIADTNQGEDDLPSCSAAEALDRQEPFINNVLASSALAMLTRLIRYGEIEYHGGFYNGQTGRSAPLPIDPDLWKRLQAKRRARKAA